MAPLLESHEAAERTGFNHNNMSQSRLRQQQQQQQQQQGRFRPPLHHGGGLHRGEGGFNFQPFRGEGRRLGAGPAQEGQAEPGAPQPPARAKAPEAKRRNWHDKLSSSTEQQKQQGSATSARADPDPVFVASAAPKRKPGSSWRYRAQHNEAKKMRREKETELNQELAGECEMCMLDDGEHEGWCAAAKKSAGPGGA